MAEFVDEDTLEAVVALWSSDPQKVLGGLFAEPIQSGELKPGRAMPYAHVQCQQGTKPNERMTGGVRQDYRKVTITVWADKAGAIKGGQAVLATFNLKLQPTEAGQPTLTYPSGARFIRWWPLNDGKLEERRAQKKGGLDMWTATLEGEIWSVRTDT